MTCDLGFQKHIQKKKKTEVTNDDFDIKLQ